MKIKIIGLFILFSVTFSVMGQSSIGVYGGLNSSKLSGDVPAKADYKRFFGANVGAFFDLQLSKSVFLSFQPSYSQEGTKVFYDVHGIANPVDSLSIRLNYFSLPILFKITSTKQYFYALSGIESALLLNSFATSHGEKEDINTEVAKWNIAVHFGVGTRIPIGIARLFVEVRYTQGLLNLTNDPIAYNTIPRVKTTGFKIITGVEIPLKLND